jgi:ParB family chromosome partitioning protein
MSVRDPAPRLGRGLAALLGDTPPSFDAGASDGVRTLPAASLEPSPYQPRGRMNEAALDELTESIRAQGVLQPLLVRPHPTAPDRFQIVAGERRWRAAQQAGLHDIPALIRPLSDTETMTAALVENLQRQDLNAIEEAEGYHRLAREFAMTQDAIAGAIGKSRSHVANMLRLMTLPDSVKHEIRQGNLSAGHARALVTHPNPHMAALDVIARGLNVRQTEALSAARAERQQRRAEPDSATRALEQELAGRLGLRVSISFDGSGGAVRIHYRSLDQLDGLIALLRGGST